MDERGQLEQAIAHLEAQRAVLGDTVVDASIAALRQRLATPVETKAPTSELQGERRLVTVMFVDIAGFTALAETMDPEQVRDLMNGCFERLVPAIRKYGGTVDKFIGDGIMALFGAPTAHENDPERALRAALEMKEALTGFSAERRANLRMHFGINTGLVFAGGIGAQGRQEYSVMGDAVNVAARLEQVSQAGEILVGPDTHRLSAPLFDFEPLPPVEVKGKSEVVPVYRLLAPKAAPGKGRGIAGLESPLVGREVESRALNAAVERLLGGAGGIVTLVGEAGLGKSRLVAEVRRDAPTGHLQWVEGRCLSYGTSIVYLLWLDILRGLLGATAEEAPAAVRLALQETLRGWCPDGAAELLPYLARLMSLPLEPADEAAIRELDGESLRAHTFRAVERLVECAARRRPLVVVCEDLHWADPASLELLEHLLASAGRVPLLFVCIFRPEHEHGVWRLRETVAQRYPSRHVDLWLDPLSSVESQVLVGNLLRVENIPPRLKERILASAEGNPFYVEEIIRSLMDSGAIAYEEAGGRWVAVQEVDEIAIPDTLHGVLMARIDRLQQETKRVLQLASVIGRIFFYRVLAAIAQEERELDRHLSVLQSEEMIRERARVPELEYIFKHHMTQEAAYRGLLRKERRLFHRQVAEALERLFPERIEEQTGLLAHHWELAEEPGKAAHYLLRAGDQARLAYAHQGAIDYYQRALTFLKTIGDHGQAARTLMKLGLVYHTTFDFQRSRQAYEEGFALWLRAGEAQPEVTLPPAPHPLRLSTPNLPTTLDPTITGDMFSVVVVEQLFGGLVELDPDLEVVPNVAQSWEVLEGGLQYVFHLRDDARWSDGSPVTAGDFEYAWKQALTPETGSPVASMLYDVKGARAFHQGEVRDPAQVGVRAVDERTLVVELEGVTGYFLHLLTQFPTHPVPRHVVETHGAAWTKAGHIVTNGPFRVDDWQRDSMLFSRNPFYHGRFGGNVQQIRLSLFGDWSAGLQAYERGELDVVPLRGFSPAASDDARRRYAGEYVQFPKLFTSYLRFDITRPPFDDVRVRRAFALAIDKETLANVVLQGCLYPATGGFVPVGMPGHSARISLPYDPQRARELLSAAGYPEGRGLPVVSILSFPGTFGRDLLFEYLRSQWRETLGVELVWDTLEWAAFVQRLEHDPPYLSLISWTADYPDPDTFLRLAFQWEVIGWQDEAYGRLVEEAKHVADQDERMRLYRLADQMLVEKLPIVPLFYGQQHMLVKPWVSKFPTSTIRGWFWKDVVVEPH